MLVTRTAFDAVLFDLDGVLTDTATVHAACWKRLFDGFLQELAAASGEAFRPFDIDTDYRRYVDGKRRLDGVRGFLVSRSLTLPEGQPDDPPAAHTVHALARRKTDLIDEAFRVSGVKAFPGSVAWARHLRTEGIRSAAVSSSRSCEAVLQAAGIADLFELSVDGQVADLLSLQGKPAPDMFLEAARQLGVEPARAVVVEDAIVGVQAGRDGGFGLVIGVARHGNAGELREHGAHVVVEDLSALIGAGRTRPHGGT